MGSNFSKTDYLEFARTLDTALLSEDRLDVAVEWIREHLAPADVFEGVHGEGDCDYDNYTHDDDVAYQIREVRDEMQAEIDGLKTVIEKGEATNKELEEKIGDLENTIASLEKELASTDR